jgi:rod shape-determining protein MreC
MAGRLPQVDRHAVVALGVIEIVCIFLLIFGNRVPIQSLTGSTAAVLAPANSILRWIESVAAGRSDATRLSRELAALRIEHDRIVDAGIENARLKALLGFSERGRPSLKAFQVTGVAGEPWPVVFHLSGGSDDGIAMGQAVLAPEGLVGRIMRVDPRTSSVALLTDPNAPIACEVVGTGVRGVLKFRFGTQPGLYLTAVPLTDTVRVGERIATAVTSTVFPPGIPVGRVAKVGREESGLLAEIRITPFAPLTRLREVLVATTSVESGWWPAPIDSTPAKAAPAKPDSARAHPDTTGRR